MKTKITYLLLAVLTFTSYAQNIEFTFANAQTTNDGMDDFYEVDIMIATIDGQADFKLGSGLVYINYNTMAFGSDIASGGVAVVTHTNPDYILGDKNLLDYYTSFLLSNNTSSRIAFSFQQGLSSGGMTSNNVTTTPKKLFHLKIKFVNSALDPMIAFEDNETQPPGVANSRDQFYTACGPSGSLALADCGSEPGTQFIDATFTSTGATLSPNQDLQLNSIAIYPNPTDSKVYISNPDQISLTSAELYDIQGRLVLSRTLNNTLEQTLKMDTLPLGLYLLTLKGDHGNVTKRVIKE